VVDLHGLLKMPGVSVDGQGMTRLPTFRAREWAKSPADGYLEQGLRVPITSRPFWVALRSAAMLAAAIIASTLSQIQHSTSVMWIFLLAAALQPLLPLVAKDGNTGALQAASDFVVIVAIVLAAPALWPASMVWLGATIVWQAIMSPTKVVVVLGVLALAATTITGLNADVSHWWIAALIISLVGVAFTILGHELRIQFRDQEQDLTITLARAGAIVHHTDLGRSAVIRVNGDIEGLTGYTADEWCTLDHRSIIHPDDLAAFWIDAADAHDGMVLDRSWRVRRRDGTSVWLRDVSRVIVDRKGAKSLRGFTLDVTTLEEANRTIAAHARTDPLTGLPNRLALNERIDECVDADLDFALLVIDLDRFKEVNDTLGHEAGDTLLGIVSERIAAALASDDLLARLGGDEFAIIVPHASNADDVVPTIDRIAFECSQPLSLRGVRVATSLSIGVAFSTGGEDDRAAVMRHADIAMYAAKRSGDVFRVFDASLEQTSTIQLSLSATLPDAIANGEFELHFEPQLDLATDRVVGAEGLARWNHPEHGLLGPAAFLDVATMSESASVFARTMVEQAVIMAKRLIAEGRPIKIAVDITMRALHEDDFSPWLFATLGRHGVAPEWLVLELTERDAQDPSSQAIATLDELRAAGIDLSIDDFGTGHPSLQRLRQLEVAELKIDRSLIEDIVENTVDREVVGSIITLATRLGTRVVAEGVEHEHQKDTLAELGCSIVQGYRFATALSPDELLAAATGDHHPSFRSGFGLP
jgi:diguanylate cyclase (GGDEF)-like protein/PAS domain S-box-containing protein